MKESKSGPARSRTGVTSSSILTSGHSTQNAFIFNAYRYPAKLSLNVPSASCSLVMFCMLDAKVAASSAISVIAGSRNSKPEEPEEEEGG